MPGGRPKAATTLRTRDIAERASREGITPLEVMIEVMRERWAFYKAQLAKPVGDGERADHLAISHAAAAAVEAAECAAPYMHPRLAAVEHTGEVQHYVAQLPDVVQDTKTWQQQHSPTVQ